MQYLRVKNWAHFQHYKDRSPPWIKLHRELLRDYQFACLQDASKLHLMLIWLLASQLGNKIPADAEWIQRQIGSEHPPDLEALISHGFLVPDSDVLAECKQSAMRETEAETETETERAETRAPRQRGTRLPADWQPNDQLRAWAVKERPDLDMQRTIDSFTDYWKGKTGASATKLDWDATFRNWVRNERPNRTSNGTVRETAAARRDREAREAFAAAGTA